MQALQSAALALTCAIAASTASAEITVGVSLGTTGAGASVGVMHRNALQLAPKTLGGEQVRYIILDDGSKEDNAAKNAAKLTEEDKVDALIGSSLTGSTFRMVVEAEKAKTPLLAPTPPIAPRGAPGTVGGSWAFVVPQSMDLMMSAVAQHMSGRGIKNPAFIGYADNFGDQVYKAMLSRGFNFSTRIKFRRDGGGVIELGTEGGPGGMWTAEIPRGRGGELEPVSLKGLNSYAPDAVVVALTGAFQGKAQIRLAEDEFNGPIYHSQFGVSRAFLQIAKKAAQGAIAPTSPLIVAEDLPSDYPTKAVSLDFVKRYESTFGSGSRNVFAGYTYDSILLLDAAAAVALKQARPGTPEFRAALRDALENAKNIVGTHGIYNMTPSNHNGLDERARVLVHVVDEEWRLMK